MTDNARLLPSVFALAALVGLSGIGQEGPAHVAAPCHLDNGDRCEQHGTAELGVGVVLEDIVVTEDSVEDNFRLAEAGIATLVRDQRVDVAGTLPPPPAPQVRWVVRERPRAHPSCGPPAQR